MTLEEDEQTDRKDETEAACPCKAEPEMLLTESLSAHHEAAQRPLAIITAPSSEVCRAQRPADLHCPLLTAQAATCLLCFWKCAAARTQDL